MELAGCAGDEEDLVVLHDVREDLLDIYFHGIDRVDGDTISETFGKKFDVGRYPWSNQIRVEDRMYASNRIPFWQFDSVSTGAHVVTVTRERADELWYPLSNAVVSEREILCGNPDKSLALRY